MRKNKAFIFIFLAFNMLMCSGCADKPENVQNDRFQDQSQADISTKQDDYKYIDVSDIAEEFEAALEGEYGQFKISGKMIPPNPENIYTMEFVYLDDFRENADEIFKIFFDDEVLKRQTIIDDPYLPGMETREFDNKQDKVYCCVGNNGFTGMHLPSAVGKFARSDTVIKTYRIDRNEFSEESYALSDGECTVKEAVDFVNDWFNTKWKPFESWYDFSVKTVMVREWNDKCYFDFIIEKYYNGIPLEEIADPNVFVGDNGYYYEKNTPNYIWISMMNRSEISLFTNGNGIIKPVQSTPVNSIISLESALKLCQSTFSGFMKMTVSDINIKYNLMPQYDYSAERFGTQQIVKILSRPVWEIIIDVPPSEYNASGRFDSYGDVRKYICIDVETGEIYYKLSVADVMGFSR